MKTYPSSQKDVHHPVRRIDRIRSSMKKLYSALLRQIAKNYIDRSLTMVVYGGEILENIPIGDRTPNKYFACRPLI